MSVGRGRAVERGERADQLRRQGVDPQKIMKARSSAQRDKRSKPALQPWKTMGSWPRLPGEPLHASPVRRRARLQRDFHRFQRPGASGPELGAQDAAPASEERRVAAERCPEIEGQTGRVVCCKDHVRPDVPWAVLRGAVGDAHGGVGLGVDLDRYEAASQAEIELREDYEGELRVALAICTAPLRLQGLGCIAKQ